MTDVGSDPNLVAQNAVREAMVSASGGFMAGTVMFLFGNWISERVCVLSNCVLVLRVRNVVRDKDTRPKTSVIRPTTTERCRLRSLKPDLSVVLFSLKELVDR